MIQCRQVRVVGIQGVIGGRWYLYKCLLGFKLSGSGALLRMRPRRREVADVLAPTIFRDARRFVPSPAYVRFSCMGESKATELSFATASEFPTTSTHSGLLIFSSTLIRLSETYRQVSLHLEQSNHDLLQFVSWFPGGSCGLEEYHAVLSHHRSAVSQ